MKRHLLILLALCALVAAMPMKSYAAGGLALGHGHGHGGGFGHGFGHGLGFGIGGYSDIYGYAELYRELNKNLPFFALHPPVYYSYPVPRTYGYSPFAYPGYVMTPEVSLPQPETIINPHVPAAPAKPANNAPADRATNAGRHVEPLVIDNPFAVHGKSVAQVDAR
jgi:hypothetical protein